jgi:hypothetical protein
MGTHVDDVEVRISEAQRDEEGDSSGHDDNDNDASDTERAGDRSARSSKARNSRSSKAQNNQDDDDDGGDSGSGDAGRGEEGRSTQAKKRFMRAGALVRSAVRMDFGTDELRRIPPNPEHGTVQGYIAIDRSKSSMYPTYKFYIQVCPQP